MATAMILYHGTSIKGLEEIRRSGVLEKPYLTSEWAEAAEWARKKAKTDRSKEVVIEVEVDEAFADQCFKIDPYRLIEAVNYEESLLEDYGAEYIAEKEEEALKKKGIKPWRWALKTVGSVKSECNIETTSIRKAEQLKSNPENSHWLFKDLPAKVSSVETLDRGEIKVIPVFWGKDLPEETIKWMRQEVPLHQGEILENMLIVSKMNKKYPEYEVAYWINDYRLVIYEDKESKRHVVLIDDAMGKVQAIVEIPRFKTMTAKEFYEGFERLKGVMGVK